MADAARYLVTARKYRPQTFADLVSQEHVSETLQNAIVHDRLAHAYLFSGPRGVGKTTAARLLAKAINCQTPLDQREGAEPCRTCENCRAFEEGRSMNVFEIDAASNNKVEDVRDLQEKLRVPPQGARRKVYIVDEVHMLSTAAFNALLKTLEEPPPHVLFIFATTEPHKVLPTILSRCQRFDFRRITVPETVERLRGIAQAESVEADEASLHLIARKGDGALRDALSLFDQAVALCGTTLTYAGLAEALGVVETDLYFEVSERAARQDPAGLLALVGTLVHRGYDLREFLIGLGEHVRNLYAAASTGSADLIEADQATQARYLEAAKAAALPDLLRALMIIDEAEREIRTSPQPRLKLELALIKLAHLERAADLRVLVQKLERLEAMAGRGELPNAPSTPQPPAATAAPKPTPQPEPKRAPEPPAAGPDEPPRDDGEPPPPRPAPPKPDPEPSAAPTGPPPRANDFFGTPALKRPRSDGGPATPEAVALSVSSPADDVRESDDFAVPLQRVREAWPQLVERVQRERPAVGNVLAPLRPAGVAGGAVQVAVPDDFSRDLLQRERESITQALAEALGEPPPPLAFVVRPAEAETAEAADPFERIKQLRHENPVIRCLFEQFGGEIVWT